jgi:hypothetical protein
VTEHHLDFLIVHKVDTRRNCADDVMINLAPTSRRSSNNAEGPPGGADDAPEGAAPSW